VAVAAGVSTFPLGALVDQRLRPLLLVLGATSVGLVALGVLLGVASLGPVAAVGLGVELVVSLHRRGAAIDGRTPLVAAGSLVVAELVEWSASARTAGLPGEPARQRIARLAALAVAALAVTAALAGVVELPFGDDLALAAVGAAGVALVTVAVTATARRAGEAD